MYAAYVIFMNLCHVYVMFMSCVCGVCAEFGRGLHLPQRGGQLPRGGLALREQAPPFHGFCVTGKFGHDAETIHI